MVFKFERKSTEKKCEKRKNRRLLWKKFCNYINLPVGGINPPPKATLSTHHINIFRRGALNAPKYR